LIEGVIEQKEREISIDAVKIAQESERQRRINEGVLGSESLIVLNEEISRRNSVKLAGLKFDTEKTRRVFEDAASDAAAFAQRKSDLAYVKNEEEKERARRIGQGVFAEASSKATAEVARKQSIELEETERARRVVVEVVAQAAAVAESQRASYLASVAVEAERVEQVDEEAKSNHPGYSLLFVSVVDELARDMEARERALNQELALDLMDLEKIRRVTVEEAYLAQDAYARRVSQGCAAIAEDEERAYRMGLEAANLAAEKADSKLNRKMAAEMEAAEKDRRTAHYPSRFSA